MALNQTLVSAFKEKGLEPSENMYKMLEKVVGVNVTYNDKLECQQIEDCVTDLKARLLYW